MTWRIEIGLKEGIRDARGDRVRRELKQHFGLHLDSIRTLDVYTVDAKLSEEEIASAAQGPFCDPVIQEASVNRPLARDFDILIEVGFRPGVTDNVGRTAREAIQHLTGRPFAPGEAVYTSVQYLITGNLAVEQAQRVAADYLANELIQTCLVVPRSKFDPKTGTQARIPKVTSSSAIHIEKIDLNVSDDRLLEISRECMLALNLQEMREIKAHIAKRETSSARRKVGLGDQLTDAELEALAQTWSEHLQTQNFRFAHRVH